MARYKCSCGHEWKPRTRPGEDVHCPKCGSWHSKLASFLMPPNPPVYNTWARPSKGERSPAVKPYESKKYDEKHIDGSTKQIKKERSRR